MSVNDKGHESQRVKIDWKGRTLKAFTREADT